MPLLFNPFYHKPSEMHLQHLLFEIESCYDDIEQ